MPYFESLDGADDKVLGKGEVVTGFDKDIYYTPFVESITNYDPADPASDWIRIKFVEDFQTTVEEDSIVQYDGRDTDHAISGRKTTTINCKQAYVAFHESILKLKNVKCYFIEALGDSRDAEDSNGKKIYSELHLYEGKFDKESKDKPTDNAYSITMEGKYNSKSAKSIFRSKTPMTCSLGGNTTASASTPKSLTLTALDIYGATVDLANEEIQGVVITKISGTGTMTQGGTNSAPTVTFSAAGSYSIKATITTKNNIVTESANITVTVS